jgi:hypothetical protein
MNGHRRPPAVTESGLQAIRALIAENHSSAIRDIHAALQGNDAPGLQL